MRTIRKEKIFTNCFCLIIGIIFTLYGYKSIAQYPVRSQISFLPPYSPSLSDYYTGTTERFVVTLTNTDFGNPLRKVRLRLNIKSNAINLRSKDYVYYPIVELDAGIPTRLSLSDLAPYFNPNNIDASGVDYNFLSKSSQLPDGYYTFRFDVIDANTGQVLNNTMLGEQNVRITTNDPPLLNLPQKGDNLAFRDPINIIFNWTPRHIGISSAEYEFSLYEINDNGMPPENAPFTSQPIYQATTPTTTLLYGPTEPQLLPSKKYAWRIKVTAMSGGEAQDLFRNNGYSETYWFQLNDNCPPVQQVAATVKNGAVTISWLDNPQMYEYTIEYRKKGNDFNRWFTTTTRDSRVVITNVSENNSYEYRVGGTCTIGAGATFSDVKAFTIPPRDSLRDKQCGIMPNINLSNQKSIETLIKGDVVNVGDFPVMITDLSSTIGSFSGKGYITIPFLGDVRVKVTFNNVVFNTDKQLIQGFMVTTYDSTGKQIADVDEIFEGGGNVGKVKTGLDTADVTFNFPIRKPEDIKVTVNADGTAIINVTGANGETKQVRAGKLPTTIKDSEGNIYNVDKDGKVTKVGKAGEIKDLDPKQLDNLQTDKAVVQFVNYENKQQYAFDQWKDVYSKSQLFKEQYQDLNGYRVSAKAIEAGKTDVVKAKVDIKDNSVKADSIRFVTSKGTRYESKSLGNNEYEITVVGGPAKDAQELYAIYPTGDNKYLSFGKLLIASYPHKKQKLILVPVNGASINKDEISKQLNSIYNKVAVEWDVQRDINFDDKTWDKNNNGLDVDGSGLFSTLTDEMKALNNAYRSKHKVDASTIYLFVLSKASQASVVGDMPRNKQFGYLFNNDGKVAAHEVGHGLFHLKHTFDGYFNGTDLGSSQNPIPNNVMSYPNGNQFGKLQWDAIHDPGLVIGLFEGDGDAKAIQMRDYDPQDLKLKADGNLIYLLTPSNQVFVIHKSILQRVAFDGFIYDKNNLLINSVDVLKGSIKAFVINGESYVAKIGNNNTFLGYYKTKNDDVTASLFELNLQTNPPFVNVGYIQANNPCILTTSTCKFSNSIDWTSETVLNNKQIISPECSDNPKIACLNQFKKANATQSYTKQQLSDFADCINDNEIDAAVLNDILNNSDKVKLMAILLEWPTNRNATFYAQRQYYNVPRNIEDAVLKIIKTISLDEASTFYTPLIQQRIHYAILSDYEMTQDKRREFVEQLTALKFATDKNGNSASLTGIEERTFILKGTSLLKNYSDIAFNISPDDGNVDNNEMLFSSTLYTWLGNEYNILKCKSDDYILIFFDDNSFIDKGFKKGDYTVLPGYYLAYLIKETDAAYKLRMMKNQAYIAFAAITLPQLASSTGIKLLLNIGDLSEMALDVTLDQVQNDLIAEVENGQEIVNALRTLQGIYVIGRLGTLAKSSAEYLVKNSEKLLAKIEVLKTRNITAYNKLKTFIVKLSERLRGTTGSSNIIVTTTKVITKSRLPNSFIEALKKFGKTEDDILEYFTNYHNIRSGQKWLNEIENFLTNANTYNLTRDEAFALWGYTTNYFYGDLNAWLRNGINATSTTEISEIINSGLAKLPNYNGVKVFRGIQIDPSQIDNFIASYSNGSTKIWNDFPSCGGSISASFGSRPDINVIFEIEHLTAKEISDLADGINYGVPKMSKPEILIKSGSYFQATADPFFNTELQKWIIKLKQIK